MTTKTKIVTDWEKVWDRFENWYTSKVEKPCSKCGHTPWADAYEWEEQVKAIQRLVKKYTVLTTN